MDRTELVGTLRKKNAEIKYLKNKTMRLKKRNDYLVKDIIEYKKLCKYVLGADLKSKDKLLEVPFN
jgi:hypothetical protein